MESFYLQKNKKKIFRVHVPMPMPEIYQAANAGSTVAELLFPQLSSNVLFNTSFHYIDL
jgi:hypothetical protein